jgi:adenine-specific DNA-methyltransferase
MESNNEYRDIIDKFYNDLVFDNKTHIDKYNWEKEDSFFKFYEGYLDEEYKKHMGRYYTDDHIVDFIIKTALEKLDLVENPYIKILDPSCGCGYFLMGAYDFLKERYERDIDSINCKFPDINLTKDNIHEHIIKNNIFGADIDEYSVKHTIVNLMMKKPSSRAVPNIICCDSVMNWEHMRHKYSKFWRNKFDFIIGNPPYIGHKKMSQGYRKKLNSIYGDIFKDKGDISFCFIKSSIDRVNEGGIVCFITSRYFIESPSAVNLRGYIKDECSIEKIIDFYGIRIMKGISVDPVIIMIRKALKPTEKNIIDVAKANKNLKNDELIFEKYENKNSSFFSFFEIPQYKLEDKGWVLLPKEEMDIINKIEESLTMRLSSVCNSFQGVITGCDKAFIVNRQIIEEYSIEKELLKRWIKNSHIKKFKVDESNLYIIYSNIIKDEEEYKRAIAYISQYRDKLESRRECRKGFRKWYELQWGRDERLFDMEKIVFPYKSSSNRFAIDKGSYSSADVYGMYLNEDYKDKLSLEFLVGLLNTKLYEFYFKSFGKKLGKDLYDYYPNTIMRLMVPEAEDKYIRDNAGIILSRDGNAQNIMENIDNYVYDMFNLSKIEIEIIEERICKG